MKEIKLIVDKFSIKGEYEKHKSFGNGHINDTFLVKCNNNGEIIQYILQKPNLNVFKNIDMLMNNIAKVTEHIGAEFCRHGVTEFKNMELVHTKDGGLYHTDEEGNVWRMTSFIDDVYDIQIITDKNDFKEAGIAFGAFVNSLKDFDASSLGEVIPNFHNTQKRLEKFKKVFLENKLNLNSTVEKEINFVLEKQDYCNRIVDAIKMHKLPLRVTHNDTKINNVLFDNVTRKAIAVIDLDTIMPGSILYDFGDAIRSGCNTASEDEKDLSIVQFSVEYFKAFTEGYLSKLKNTLTQNEVDSLAFGALLMTLECGIRFLTDYLEGNVYFKTKYFEHNLDRCRTQFKLVEEIEKRFNDLNEIVKEMYCIL